MNSKGSR